jgi:glycosyltransferase involved in cell wall biosynthesis
MTARKISIIIPCYNEVRTIESVLALVQGAGLPGWEKEIIVVDDASRDGTRDILKRHENEMRVIYCDKNGGKGTAVRRGMEQATGEYVLIQDADLEYDPGDIPSLLAAVDAGDADVVYGSRNLSPRTRRGGAIARAGVWFITKLINLLYGLSLTDVWTCYKLFPRAAGGDFAAGRFESELLFTAALARRGYRFSEVPISYAPRAVAEGKKIRYRDGIHAIIAIVLDWVRHF